MARYSLPQGLQSPLMALIFIATFLPQCEAARRSTSQFGNFYSSMRHYYNTQVDGNCDEQMTDYLNKTLTDAMVGPTSGHIIAHKLVDCMMDNLSEVVKVEFAMTALLLGLMPGILSQIAPPMADVAMVATRRPLLGLLLGFGAMSPNPAGLTFSDPVVAFRETKRPLKTRIPIPLRALLGFIEYVVAIGASANCVYQIYFLTIRAVPYAPIAIIIPNIPEHYILYFYILLNIPIQLLNMAAFKLQYRDGSVEERGWSSFMKAFPFSWLWNEVVPGRWAKPYAIVEREGGDFCTIMAVLCQAVAFVLAILHIILGTVLMGSILFITLADILEVVEPLVVLALATRFVVYIEVHGMATRASNAHNRVNSMKHLARDQHAAGYSSGYQGPNNVYVMEKRSNDDIEMIHK